mmetsp:Transcript_29034/g.47663  ORF Transcript_29034/g.47663 Transcript_29034/m.47663 type:complete len:87 (+) Transcript_29034:413-673(+)
MQSDNTSVGDSLDYSVDAINNYWIDRSEEDRPLAKWTYANLVQMATALAHGRLDNQLILSTIYEESLEILLPMKGFSMMEQISREE